MKVRIYFTLTSIPSVTGAPPQGDLPYGQPVFDALTNVLTLCESFGFRTKNCSNYLGWAEIGQGEEMIGILVHLDVVPVGDGWIHPPFALTVADGLAYGRGVVDDKGPAIASIFAMKDILDSGIPLNKRISIIFGCQEEGGDWLDMAHYRTHEERPSYGFTPDADFPAIHGEKGLLIVTLTMPQAGTQIASVSGGQASNVVPDFAQATLVTGKTFSQTGISAHGSLPSQGENAISKVMAAIAASGSPCKFAQFYNETMGFATDGSLMNCGLQDEPSGALTMNVGVISSDGENITLKVDFRYPVTYSREEILERITQRVTPYGVAVQEISRSQSVYMDKDGPVITQLLKAYRQETGDMSPSTVIGGGTYARAMDNIVAFGPLLPGRPCTEHQKNECIPVDDLFLARKIYGNAIHNLLSL